MSCRFVGRRVGCGCVGTCGLGGGWVVGGLGGGWVVGVRGGVGWEKGWLWVGGEVWVGSECDIFKIGFNPSCQLLLRNGFEDSSIL